MVFDDFQRHTPLDGRRRGLRPGAGQKATTGLPSDRLLELPLLADRTSVEVFVLGGRYVMSFCRPLGPEKGRLSLTADGQTVIRRLEVHELRSIGEEKNSPSLPPAGAGAAAE